MEPKNWSFTISLLLAGMVVACTPSAQEHPQVSGSDSLHLLELSAKLDSIKSEIRQAEEEQATILLRMDALKDSLSALEKTAKTRNEPDVGGEARGAPIRRDNKANSSGK